MKKFLMIAILCMSILLFDNTSNYPVLKAGLGSSDFGIAFVGVGVALLIRGGDRK